MNKEKPPSGGFSAFGLWILIVNQKLTALLQRAVTSRQHGNLSESSSLWEKITHIEPKSAEYWFNFGEVLLLQGEVKTAFQAFLRVSELSLNNPHAQNAIGFHFLNMNRLDEARACLEKALSLDPSLVTVHVNLGLLAEKQGDLKAAEVYFRKALALEPRLATAYANLGGVLNAQRRHRESLQICRMALQHDPTHTQAWANFALAFVGVADLSQAKAVFERALEISPSFGLAWANYGALLIRLKHFKLAVEALERAMTLNVENDVYFGSLFFARLSLCDWSTWLAHQAQLSSGIQKNLVLSAPFPALGFVNCSEKLKMLTELYAQSTLGTVTDSFIPSRRKTNARVRVGYFSADFRDHPVGFLLVDLLKSHDRSQFELVGFAFSSESSDAMGTVFQGLFDQYHDVREASDDELIHLARSCELDLAIDLGGYTAGSRPQLFAARVAPVQISYLGFPGTMAMPSMDYLIADKRVIPETDFDSYSEKLIHLPRTFFPPNCYHAPSGLPMTRVELGLPDSGFVFACFNNSYKINPDVFDAWMSILRDVPNSVIWLSHMDDDAKTNLRREAEYRGVDSGRLVFACRMQKREDHLERIRLADLFLDTWPYGAHTTASDALWVGLPVLTVYGKTFAGRVASSLLSALGLQALVASTVAEYKSMAVGLAEDKPHLLGLRSQLLKAGPQSPVQSPVRYIRSLEKAYMAAHERCENGLEPTHLKIEH